MELEELQCQDQIRQELVTAETKFQNLKKDYDKLTVEHQQVRTLHDNLLTVQRTSNNTSRQRQSTERCVS